MPLFFLMFRQIATTNSVSLGNFLFIRRNIAVERNRRFAGVIAIGGDGDCYYRRRNVTKRRLEVSRHIALRGEPLIQTNGGNLPGDQYPTMFPVPATASGVT